jgi:hypothetical protein
MGGELFLNPYDGNNAGTFIQQALIKHKHDIVRGENIDGFESHSNNPGTQFFRLVSGNGVNGYTGINPIKEYGGDFNNPASISENRYIHY